MDQKVQRLCTVHVLLYKMKCDSLEAELAEMCTTQYKELWY